MVHTRNQKRKYEELELCDINSNLEINQDFTNIKITKRSKGDNQHNQDKLTQTEIQVKSEIDMETETEMETKSETDSGDEPQIESDTDSNVEQQEPNVEQTLDKKDIDVKNEDTIEDIIKKSLMHFVDKFNQKKDEKNNKPQDDFDVFLEYVKSIYDGDFFERVSVHDKKNQLQNTYTKDDIKMINSQLETIKNNYQSNGPNIIDIIKMNTNIAQKQKLLERMHHYANSDLLTSEYTANLNTINKSVKKYQDNALQELEEKILESSMNLEYSDNYREKILRSDMPFQNKVIAYKRLDVMESFEATDTSEYSKYKSWMDILLSIPFNKNTSTIVGTLPTLNSSVQQGTLPTLNSNLIKNVRTILDKRLSFLERPKDQIVNIVTQMIRNPNFTTNAIGLYGGKGVGKSAIIKSISEALGRPYRTISLGGESDSSLLTGHGFTYVGSCPGRIIEILRDTKCTNPIILFDELDKVSETHHGKEIIGNLIHLTDSTTNNKYNYDKYFSGLDFDLSKVLFIFTYNDATKIDPILADRLFKIHVDNYSVSEKLEIAKLHLIPNILEQYFFTSDYIQITNDAIDYVVEMSKSDQGMRDIKRKFEIIISRVNTLLLTDPDDNIVKLKYKKLYDYYKKQQSPIQIIKDHIDILLSESTTDNSGNNDPPPGMYI